MLSKEQDATLKSTGDELSIIDQIIEMYNYPMTVEILHELYEWGRKWNVPEKMVLRVLEQSLESGNLDYLHWQMEHFEAWCKVDTKWLIDPIRRAKILRPISQFPSSYKSDD